MFTAETDRSLGLPVVHMPYKEGEAGISEQSIPTICKKIREGMITAVMKSYAGNVIKQSGALQGTTRDRAIALVSHVHQAAGYAPDALGSEQIQSAAITLCVEGAPICIPIGDCDDLITATGTLCGAAGMDVEVVRQFFGAGHQQHVLLEVKLDDGSWYPLDPSNRAAPFGVKAPAQRETRHSPFDSKLTGLPDQAQFVGMGALPVWVWQEPHAGFPGRWARIPSNTKLEGLGAVLPSLSDLQPQLKWLGTIWSTIDPKGRSWDTTLSDAYNRAEQKNWVAGDSTSYFDLTAIIVRSAFLSRAASAMPSPGPDAANALDNTWKLIASKLGYTSQTSMDDLKTAAKRNNQVAALALFELIAVIVAIAALAVVYCFAIYYAAKIVDSLLTRLVAFAEEVWRNVQIQKIVDRHVNNPDLPWDPEEKKLLGELEKEQDETHKAVIRPPDLSPPSAPPSFWDSPWAIFGIVTVVAGATAAVVYRKEIKGAIERRAA
jgi:hypothetical protein